MTDDMGIFRTRIAIAPLTEPQNRRDLEVMVDTESAYNWVPRSILEELGIEARTVESFETANGDVLERDIGLAMLYAAGRTTATVVVFGEPGDMTLLGAIGLEGLNLRVDLNRKELVPAGPVPVAVAKTRRETLSIFSRSSFRTYGDHEVSVDIRDGRVAGSFPKKTLRLVQKWRTLHPECLIRALSA